MDERMPFVVRYALQLSTLALLAVLAAGIFQLVSTGVALGIVGLIRIRRCRLHPRQ